jgi:hypothetical protein
MSKRDKNPENYWFRAKRYGWGWGLPLTWQGWIVLIAYIGFVVAGTYIFPPEENKAVFIVVVILLSLIFIAICWIKGEPTRWRWGKDKDAKID